MKGKKGLSAIVATVLILLMTIALAAILFSFIIPFVNKNLTSSTECIPYRAYFTFNIDLQHTCYDQYELVGFSVKALASSSDLENLKNFSVVLIGDGITKTIRVNAGDAASSSQGGLRMLDRSAATLTVPNSGETWTYVYNGSGEKYNQIEIYPVLPSGRLCDRSDVADLRLCMGVNLSP